MLDEKVAHIGESLDGMSSTVIPLCGATDNSKVYTRLDAQLARHLGEAICDTCISIVMRELNTKQLGGF